MTNLFVIAFFGFNVDGNETLKRTTAFIKQKYKILQFYWWQMSLFFNNGAIYKLEQGVIFKLEQSDQVFPSFSPCSSLPSAASENNCLKYSLFFVIQWALYMNRQKHLAGWQTTQWGKENQRDITSFKKLTSFLFKVPPKCLPSIWRCNHFAQGATGAKTRFSFDYL